MLALGGNSPAMALEVALIVPSVAALAASRLRRPRQPGPVVFSPPVRHFRVVQPHLAPVIPLRRRAS